MIGLSDGALARIAIAACVVAPRRRRKWLADIARRLEALTPGPAAGGRTAASRVGRLAQGEARKPFAVPLRPDYSAVRGRPSDAIVRALLAAALAEFERVGSDKIAARLWPADESAMAAAV